jgi:GH35 family endo-1,4-beta-xylanase
LSGLSVTLINGTKGVVIHTVSSFTPWVQFTILGHVDTIVDWTLSKQLSIKGHVLIWHVTSPVELLETTSPFEVSSAIKQHIFTTMRYYIDRIKIWDVVNEELAHDGT